LSQADFSKNPVISFSVLRAKENTTHSGGVFFGYGQWFKRPPGSRRGARGAPPVAGGATRASGSGLYFQGGYDRRRKYRAPQQGVGSSPA